MTMNDTENNAKDDKTYKKNPSLMAIVAADEKWAIGNKGNLLVRIPADHKNFSALTTGKVIVLGRKTLETFPQGKPLPDRINIILSANKDFEVKGAIAVHDTQELMEEIKKYDAEDVFVIGGQSVYEQLLPMCRDVLVTRIDHTYEADAHFPDLDNDPEWEITEMSDEQYYFDITYHFVRYTRRN